MGAGKDQKDGEVSEFLRPDRKCSAANGATGRRAGGYYGEPRLWPNAAALKGVSDERAGKVRKAAAPVFWTVGAEEIPTT